MRLEDFNAIKEFDPSKNTYLSVKSDKNGQQHLEVKKRTFLGRMWMKLGFSSSSIEKVASYLSKNIDTADIKLAVTEDNKPAFQKLSDKLFKHLENQNFRAPRSISEAQEVTYLIVNDPSINANVKNYPGRKEHLEKEIKALQVVLNSGRSTKLEKRLEALTAELQKVEKKIAIAELCSRILHP